MGLPPEIADMIQQQRVDFPGVRRVGIVYRPDGTPVDNIPMSPADPGWREKIPPPEPDSVSLASSAPRPESRPEPKADRRVVVSFGRREGLVMLAVEVAPDWDTVGVPLEMDIATARRVVEVLRLLGIRVKNLVGADLYDPSAVEGGG